MSTIASKADGSEFFMFPSYCEAFYKSHYSVFTVVWIMKLLTYLLHFNVTKKNRYCVAAACYLMMTCVNCLIVMPSRDWPYQMGHGQDLFHLSLPAVPRATSSAFPFFLFPLLPCDPIGCCKQTGLWLVLCNHMEVTLLLQANKTIRVSLRDREPGRCTRQVDWCITDGCIVWIMGRPIFNN